MIYSCSAVSVGWDGMGCDDGWEVEVEGEGMCVCMCVCVKSNEQ